MTASEKIGMGAGASASLIYGLTVGDIVVAFLLGMAGATGSYLVTFIYHKFFHHEPTNKNRTKGVR